MYTLLMHQGCIMISLLHLKSIRMLKKIKTSLVLSNCGSKIYQLFNKMFKMNIHIYILKKNFEIKKIFLHT
jgi:uncharacterized membrane protein YhfC